MTSIASTALIVPSSACNFCEAARVLSKGHKDREDFNDDARSQMCVAFTVGFRRDPIQLCTNCKGKLERLSHAIEVARIPAVLRPGGRS